MPKIRAVSAAPTTDQANRAWRGALESQAHHSTVNTHNTTIYKHSLLQPTQLTRAWNHLTGSADTSTHSHAHKRERRAHTLLQQEMMMMHVTRSPGFEGRSCRNHDLPPRDQRSQALHRLTWTFRHWKGISRNTILHSMASNVGGKRSKLV